MSSIGSLASPFLPCADVLLLYIWGCRGDTTEVVVVNKLRVHPRCASFIHSVMVGTRLTP